jgi:hypothetical protein
LVETQVGIAEKTAGVLGKQLFVFDAQDLGYALFREPTVEAGTGDYFRYVVAVVFACSLR